MSKRENLRIEYLMKCIISFQDNVIEAIIKNLTMQGIFVQTYELVPLDSEVNLSIVLTTDSSKTRLNIKGKVIRVNDDGLAINFIDVEVNSFIILRNLVAHYTYDENKIIKEFEDTYPMQE